MPICYLAVDKKVDLIFKSDINIARRGKGSNKEDFFQDQAALEYAKSLLKMEDSCISSEWGSKLAKVWKCKLCNKLCFISNLAFTSRFKKTNGNLAGPGVLYTTLNNESIFYRKHMATHNIGVNPENSDASNATTGKRKREDDEKIKSKESKKKVRSSSVKLNKARVQNLNIKVPIPISHSSPNEVKVDSPTKMNEEIAGTSNNQEQLNPEETNKESHNTKIESSFRKDISLKDESIARTLILFSKTVNNLNPRKVSEKKTNEVSKRVYSKEKPKVENLIPIPIPPREKLTNISNISSDKNQVSIPRKSTWKAWDSSLPTLPKI